MKLLKSPADSTLSIVAVHGLGGDWEETWTDPDSDRLWLRDFVPEQFSDLRFRAWSYGYDSTTALSKTVAETDDAAIALVDAIHGERRQDASRRKPIIFIAHSLGGIIVKRVSSFHLYEVLSQAQKR